MRLARQETSRRMEAGGSGWRGSDDWRRVERQVTSASRGPGVLVVKGTGGMPVKFAGEAETGGLQREEVAEARGENGRNAVRGRP